jgi:Flp pilus assembly protein TadB
VHVHAGLYSLRESHWHDYAARFLLGGAATVLTGIIAAYFGPLVGGLFLAFPAILPATATLVERHARERKEAASLSGGRRGREVAALEAAGASLGSIGLMAFAVVIWLTIPKMTWLAFLLAGAAWIAVSLLMWFVRRPLRRLMF